MVKLAWWKWMAIIIMPYVILMGFMVPLGQGIIQISPYTVKSLNTNTLFIEGYNTRFTSEGQIKAWLRQGDWHLEADRVLVQDERHASLVFSVPVFPDAAQKQVDLSLVMDTPDGPLVLPSAVSLANDESLAAPGFQSNAQWSREMLTVREESNFNYPFRNILGETIRNTYFHVPLWFAMVMVFLFSVYYSYRYLRFKEIQDEWKTESLVVAGVLFGILGTITGAIWARFTWGAFWSFDVKQNMTAIALLIYGGYFLIRSNLGDPDAKARISSIYNIFAFVLLIPLIFIIPRRFDSLHPGSGGNPAFGSQDLDSTMRLVFYPAVIAYICIAFWISEIRYRIMLLSNKMD